MPDRNYIPVTLADEAAWIANFAGYIAPNFSALALEASDNAAIQLAAGNYATAFVASQSADTRTTATIAAFITTQTQALETMRFYAQFINNSPNTTDEQRASLQITIRKTTKTPIAAPLSYPLLTVLAAFPLQHKMTYKDSEAGILKTKAKPFGAAALQLFLHVGATPPANPNDAKFVGLYTRAPFIVEHDPANTGQTAYYYSRWVTSRGLEGPLVGPVAMTIAA